MSNLTWLYFYQSFPEAAVFVFKSFDGGEVMNLSEAAAHKALHQQCECDFCDLMCDRKSSSRHVRNKHRRLAPEGL